MTIKEALRKAKRIRSGDNLWAEFEAWTKNPSVNLFEIHWLHWAEENNCLPSSLKAALAEYKRVEQSALAEHERVIQPAWAKYERVEQPAWAEYKRVIQPAWAKYERVEQPALDDLASAVIACIREAKS